MKSKVYFVPVSKADSGEIVKKKLKTLLEKSGVLGVVERGDKVAAKIHFGEEGNTGYVDPELAGVICRAAVEKGGEVYLADTNVLYKGSRTVTADHIKLALKHGFSKNATGVDIFIPDDTKKEETLEIAIGQKYIRTAKVGRFFIDCDSLVTISHFKGHMLTGFGGAIKNLGMGCATRQGKLAQHNNLAPAVYPDNCVACGACVAICPVNALTLKGDNAKISLDAKKCIGCANCVGVCSTFSLFVDFTAGSAVQEKMAEYAFAVLRNKKKKAVFINFAMKINKECDCWGGENPGIAPDVGIFASLDPVAIDKASYDIVNRVCKKNVFRSAHPDQDGTIQITHAEKIGLGRQEYDLVEV
ncbi:MAG: DUF362 domain-containing protein [Candidatus Omnitrophica bacterium]|nr:DUF362 domain-containing protein [Candidatus Omnitrophota bacterium]